MSSDGEDRVAGMAVAFDEVAMGRLSAPDQGADQPDLLDEGEVGAGPMDEPLKHLGAAMFGTPRRGGGRPAGAKNRSTEAWRAFYLSQRRDPAFVLGDLYSMPVEEMALRLGCDRLDAIKVQMRAAEILMPYLHQKQPLAIKNADANLPTLHLVMPAAMAGTVATDDAGAGQVLDLFATEVQQNQSVSAGDAQAVGTGELVESQLPQQDQRFSACPQGIANPVAGGGAADAGADPAAIGADGQARRGATPPEGGAAEIPLPDTELGEV